MTDYRAQLRAIRTFPSLVKFLRDELDWPVETDDFEDLTFDYEPEELGIDKANAAKIDEIKRLRPLVPNQPWGIFFVKFEPKQLPVVALRRILAGVVVKKRATASAAEQPKWAEDDLLFISNYGEGDERRISFAHFSKDPAKSDLPTLKVIAWDELDTPLHLDHTADLLVERLSWPTDGDEWDDETWRERWSSAFELRHREVITTSKVLAERLAELARRIRAEILRVLEIETDDGKVTRLMTSFRESLVHDLDAAGFADMYAQTIAYGLLSARIADPQGQTADDLATHMRTNPFLREMLETFLHVGGRRGKAGGPGIDFDELGVGDVVALLDDANMEAVVRDFGDRNSFEDPVIHFYEHFLSAYDKKLKIRRGVFYTPRPVVSYIVRSIHELLRNELGLADGLADTAAWDEVADRLGVEIPEGVGRRDRFVTILDPATGTGTFLVEAIDVIHGTLIEKWTGEGKSDVEVAELWNEYVPEHLLPRLHGYELMMAPYAIAHLKVGLKLYETGYRFQSDERARVYLTNSLEPSQDFTDQFEFTVPALAHEVHAVNAVKQSATFTVIIGNPPYSSSTTSNEWVVRLMDDWKKGLDETKVDVMREEWKFLRFAQSLASAAGTGVVGYVVNRDFLDGVTKRRLRESLQETFSTRRVVDLNGDVKGEVADENVFEIMQGVCVSVLATRPAADVQTYVSLEGTRESKFEWLMAGENEGLHPHVPTPPLFKWSTRLLGEGGAEYQDWFPLNDVFTTYSSGIQTQRDGVCIAWDAEALWERVSTIAAGPLEEARASLNAGKDGRDWRMASVRADVLASGPSREHVTRVLYRPFDVRFTYWTGKTKGFHAYPRRDVMKHVVGRDNIGLIFNRQVVGEKVSHFGVSRLPTCAGVFYLGNKGSDYLAPLFVYDDGLLGETAGRRSNLSDEWLERLALSVTTGDVEPFAHLGYVYAVLHSPAYRRRYVGRLKEEFARVPTPIGRSLFDELSNLGRQLIALHTMESPALESQIARHEGAPAPTVGTVVWIDETVWLDGTQTSRRIPAQPGTSGFVGVTEDVWAFEFGGYQVCHKWLKDRRGRTLSDDDIAHYQKIVVAISETIRLMKEIDEVVEQHGGWPGAFAIANGGGG